MLYAVRYDGIKLGILDTDDRSIEFYKPSEIKYFIKDLGIKIYGVKLAEDINPLYTLDGLQVNLYYEKCNRVDRFRVVLLKPGDRWGATFKTVINKYTVAFFDTGVDLSMEEYPSGQYITSYYADTILKHDANYGLVLDNDVPVWKISPIGMRDIQMWLKHQMN